MPPFLFLSDSRILPAPRASFTFLKRFPMQIAYDPEKSEIRRIIHLAGDVGGVAPAPYMKKPGRSPHMSGQGLFKSEAASRSIITRRCAPHPQ